MASNETVGQRLRRLREEKGLTQRQLAQPGCSYAYISRIEHDQRRPSVKALRLISRKLGVSAYYLENGEQDPTVERCWQLLEIAKHWRRRAEMLDRRLLRLEPLDAEPEPLVDELEAELARLGQTTIEDAVLAAAEEVRRP